MGKDENIVEEKNIEISKLEDKISRLEEGYKEEILDLKKKNEKLEEMKNKETSKNAGYEEEILNLNKKFKILIWSFILVCMLIVAAISYFIINNKTIQPKETITETVVKIDLSEFKKSWNKKVYQIKYDNSFMNIKFDTYELDKEIKEELNTYLYVNKAKALELKKELKESDNVLIYIPIISWIDKNIELKSFKSTNITNSSQLMKEVANTVNPMKPFSNKTIDTVLQLNEFCYYFEKNKKDFYRDGYSKNIKYCKDIVATLKDDEKIKNKNLASIK